MLYLCYVLLTHFERSVQRCGAHSIVRIGNQRSISHSLIHRDIVTHTLCPFRLNLITDSRAYSGAVKCNSRIPQWSTSLAIVEAVMYFLFSDVLSGQELCLRFLDFLDVGSLGRSSTVASKWNQYASSDTIWKQRVKNMYPGSSRAQKFGFACVSMMLLYRQRHLLERASRSQPRWNGHMDKYALIVELHEDDKVIFADALKLDCFSTSGGTQNLDAHVKVERTPAPVEDVMNLVLSLSVARQSDSKCMLLCTKTPSSWVAEDFIAFKVPMHVDRDRKYAVNGTRLEQGFAGSVWYVMRLDDLQWRAPADEQRGLDSFAKVSINILGRHWGPSPIEIVSLWHTFGTWL